MIFRQETACRRPGKSTVQERGHTTDWSWDTDAHMMDYEKACSDRLRPESVAHHRNADGP